MTVPGHLIAGRYRLVTQVGTGGMGVVWEGWDERLQRRVAVKQLRLPPELTDHERELASQRAMREARITARLHHPHAVSVFDVVDDDGRPSLIMQFVPSKTLSEVLAEGGPLPPAVVARLGAEVASALSAAHELGIVHRDVKPANVLVAEDGTAHISDFGISRALDDISMTTTGMVHGTPAYLSPEVARGEQATFASDLFGLGATLYTALEGSPPFGTDTNSIALLHRVASGDFEPPRNGGPLTPLLLQLLASDPAARPPMSVAATTLGELAAGPADADPAAAGDRSETDELTTPLATPLSAPLATSADAATEETPIGPTAETVAPDPQAPAFAEKEQDPESWPGDDSATSELTSPIATPAETVTTSTLAADQLEGTPPRETATVEPQTHAVAAAQTDGDAPTDGDGARLRRTWRRRRAALVAVLVTALAAVGIGTAVWLGLLGNGPDRGTVAGPPNTSKSTASTRATGSPPPSPTGTTPAPRSPGRSASPSPRPTPTPPPAGKSVTAAQLRNAITSYYALMPANTDRAWTLMTGSYKAHHMSGRQAYDGFWAAIDQVETRDVTATPPDRAEATLVYHRKNGEVVTERTSFQLVDEGGTLKIADSSVLSSSTR